jgi:hypothetical protein
VAEAFFLDEKHLFAEAEPAAQADAAVKPNFHRVIEREVDFARQFTRGHFSAGQPLAITFVTAAGSETEFALGGWPILGVHGCLRVFVLFR